MKRAKEKTMTIIIAGDRRQAEYYAHKVGLFQDEWRYASEPRHIRGRKGFVVVYAGQYYKSKMYSEPENRAELEVRAKKTLFESKCSCVVLEDGQTLASPSCPIHYQMAR